MTAILEWALANSAMALLLAAAAYASGWLQRPAITHALWLLVLLRLVAPPLWNVPVTWQTATVVEQPQPAVVSTTIVEPEALWESELEPASGRETKMEATPVTAVMESQPLDWKVTIAVVWASGSAFCFGLTLVRIGRFRRLLKHTQTAPTDWQSETEAVARRMGLRRGPELRLVDGAIAPLLWAGFSRPILLLPARLVSHIDAERRATLVAHELAHYRRGDHFVRWLELAATVLFWWNPIVWFARRELRESEEQLCDSWVVWVMPDARRAYAAALVDTVDYLSETSSKRPAMPALASGLGEVRQLKRRIVMIMNGQTPRQLRRWALALGCSVFAAVLSISPSFADDEPPLPPLPPSAPRAPQPPEPPVRAEGRRLDPEKAEQAEQIRAEMRKLRETMQRLERRLAEIEGRPVEAATAASPVRAIAGRVATRPEVATAPAPGAPPRRTPGDPSPDADGPRGRGPAGGAFGGGFGAMHGGMPANLERRMDGIERAIEQLSRELAEMRRSMRENRGGDGERRERRPSASGGDVAPAFSAPPTTPAVRSAAPRR